MMLDEKPDMKPIETEIPREFDLKRVPIVTRSGKWKTEVCWHNRLFGSRLHAPSLTSFSQAA